MELHEAAPVYEKIIHYDEVKETQIRLTVSSFRGIEYLHVRKYYLGFDEEWLPSADGIAMELDFDNSRELFLSDCWSCSCNIFLVWFRQFRFQF